MKHYGILLGLLGAFAAGVVMDSWLRARGPFVESRSGTMGDVKGADALEPVPYLVKPFDGTPPLTGWFDHAAGRREGWQLTTKGEWERGLAGHSGYDWAMEEGSPVYASADGVVVLAGLERPFNCPLTGGVVTDQLVVKIHHKAPDGSRLLTAYAHLSAVDVKRGERVKAGEKIGEAGDTGCADGTHLHFAVWRSVENPASALRPVDPFGWSASTHDPLLRYQNFSPSIWLWEGDRAPVLP